MGFIALLATEPAAAQSTVIRVIDTALYFDGYAGLNTTYPVQPGLIRHRNDLYARKLTSAEINQIGNTLQMRVTIEARCDNYDRIGNVNLAFVTKGATTYDPDSVPRIEIARYITPFMNKNVQPDTVPYNYNINNVAQLLKDANAANIYDIWVELEVFGVPYAAQTQVSGCAGRTDVFYGSLQFMTDAPTPAENTNVLVPIAFKEILNNYNANNTDTVGKTTKTYTFTTTALTDAALFLITSNHGANAGGEEYNRRDHYVFVDGVFKMMYKPGRTSCEPWRKYNTQGNGIYGATPRSDAQWQSFSNWCPGDVIDTRQINLGPLSAGTHTFMITVPDAVFANGEGYFPVSLYLHGKTSGVLNVPAVEVDNRVSLYPNPATETVTIESNGMARLQSIRIVNAVGALVFSAEGINDYKKTLPINGLATGLYIVHIQTAAGNSVQKLQVQ